MHGPVLEIHLVRRASPKRLGPCGQQSVTNLYTREQVHSTWNVTTLYGNNTSRAKNTREPASSTRLIVNCHLRIRYCSRLVVLGMCASLKIVNPPAGSKWAGLGPDIMALPGRA